MYAQKRYLNNLVDPSFQGVSRLFVLCFENENYRVSYSNYCLPKVEIKDYNITIDGKNFLDQPINSKFKTNKKTRRISTGQGDDFTICFLLDYSNIKDYYKMIAIDLNKQQTLDADPISNKLILPQI